ncbi:MAG: AMP-binding protein [Variovorax sp.]|nr:AMP-binding protein [Variovorax sp.]
MSMPIRTLQDIETFEAEMPLSDRLPLTVYRLFQHNANRFSNRTALTMVLTGAEDETPRRISYVELHGRLCQTANMLAALGGRGVTVAYLLPTLPETHAVLWAAETVGRAVPLNPLLQVDQLVELIASSGATVLVTCSARISSQIWEKCNAIRKELRSLKIVCLSASQEDLDMDDHLVDFDAALQGHPSEQLAFEHDIDPDRVVAYFHTGGTTGMPKLVAHTHRNQLAAALGAAALLDLRADDVVTNGMPLFHVGGVIASSLAFFMQGANVVMLSPLGLRDPNMVRRFWRIVENNRITVVGAVPTAFAAILSLPIDGNLDTVRFGITGSAPIPRSLVENFVSSTGRQLHEILGMTESGGVTAIDPVAGSATIGSVGLRIPYTSLQVRRRLEFGGLGPDCSPGEIGVLVVSGPTVSPGYRHAVQGQGVFAKGHLDSGDLAYFDESGKLHIAGRAKDLIIRSGHNIDPGMIEAAFLAHPSIAQVAAVGQPDSYAGELPVCYVVLRPGASVAELALKEYAQERIAERPAWPKNVYTVPALPMTSVGKVYKPALRADAAMRVLQPLLHAAMGKSLLGVNALDGGKRGMRVVVRLDAPSENAVMAARSLLDAFLFEYELVDAHGLPCVRSPHD